MVNITRFLRTDNLVEFEVEHGSSSVFRREYEACSGKRRSVCGVLTLDEAREEQMRLIGAGYRATVVE